MAASYSLICTLPNLQSPSSLLQKQKSSFLGETIHHPHTAQRQQLYYYYYSRRSHRSNDDIQTAITSKFNLFEIMGGRGLCNGEKSLQEELMKKPITQLVVSSPPDDPQTNNSSSSSSAAVATSTSSLDNINLPENAFEKELLGLTGGFPGGEKGLQSFIDKNPPPPKSTNKRLSGSTTTSAAAADDDDATSGSSTTTSISSNYKDDSNNYKPKPAGPELPILMPGMMAIVKNPRNPFYMYCGIIQRITDGRAGVLFEGGNWDKILTFQLNELERRDKGPPMVNPKSVVLEQLEDKSSTTSKLNNDSSK